MLQKISGKLTWRAQTSPRQLSDPDHTQNQITWFWSHCGHFLKIFSKFDYNFLSYVAN